MKLNTILLRALSAVAGKPIHTPTARAFPVARKNLNRNATLSREEFQQAVIEVLG